LRPRAKHLIISVVLRKYVLCHLCWSCERPPCHLSSNKPCQTPCPAATRCGSRACLGLCRWLANGLASADVPNVPCRVAANRLADYSFLFRLTACGEGNEATCQHQVTTCLTAPILMAFAPWLYSAWFPVMLTWAGRAVSWAWTSFS
jgi:hypothetical protein